MSHYMGRDKRISTREDISADKISPYLTDDEYDILYRNGFEIVEGDDMEKIKASRGEAKRYDSALAYLKHPTRMGQYLRKKKVKKAKIKRKSVKKCRCK